MYIFGSLHCYAYECEVNAIVNRPSYISRDYSSSTFLETFTWFVFCCGWGELANFTNIHQCHTTGYGPTSKEDTLNEMRKCIISIRNERVI